MLQDFVHNFTHNLFKPLLLFFYAGFLIPVLRVNFEFPKVLYQGLTIYLLLAIGWHGGEELAGLTPGMLEQALGFMMIGFVTNTLIGFLAYSLLRKCTKLRQIDAATVGGYYGSDSAGTFVTAVGVLAGAQIVYASYMPVLLAVMEIPGCLVALALVSRMRRTGMDAQGNMPGEPLYAASDRAASNRFLARQNLNETADETDGESSANEELVGAGVATAVGEHAVQRSGLARAHRTPVARYAAPPRTTWGGNGHVPQPAHPSKAEQLEADLALQDVEDDPPVHAPSHPKMFSREMLHEIFFNPGIYLLFAGITVGFISRKQGEKVTFADDALFVNLFQGLLCLFLLEMGMTASKKLKDLKAGGWPFIVFGLAAPNVFAAIGLIAAHGYSLFLGQPFEIGTYVLFMVLCGAASYIALPAVQRLAIPEASPTLPLAASLGLTFSYNVTIGIPVYILLAKIVTTCAPVAVTV